MQYSIITPPLDLEHWQASIKTGPATMLNAMHTCDTLQWVDRKKSVEQLIQWWVNMPSYDPDVEPEHLIQQEHLTHFQSEVIGIAAMRRILQPLFSWNTDKGEDTRAWLSGKKPNIARHILDLDTNNALWWHRCLFDSCAPEHAERTNNLITRAYPDHHFSTLTIAMDMPLRELLATLLPKVPSTPFYYEPLDFSDMC